MPPVSKITGIGYSDEALKPAAAALAERLYLPLLKLNVGYEPQLLLHCAKTGLELVDTAPGAPGAVKVDFAALRHRARSLRSEAVARAVGLKGKQPLTVIDATAGLGRDAFVLASLGAQVVLVERDPIIAALLEDGLRRAAADPELAPTAARMRLERGDAIELLPALLERHQAQVVYLDPMYPEEGTKGQVKKEMQLLRRLLGPDPDIEPLFLAALECSARRVVLKRPRRSAPLAGRRPSHSVEGRSTRFDVYVKAP